MKKLLTSFAVVVVFLAVGTVYASEDFLSAIQAMQAIRDVSKTEAIMLNPEVKSKVKTVYVEVTNSSSVNLDTANITNAVTTALREKGYEILNDPAQAGYVVQIDFTKLNIIKEKKSNFFGGLLGGIARTVVGAAGAVAGATTGIVGSQIITQASSHVGEAVGSAVGSGIDNALSGENYSYLGSIVIFVKEKDGTSVKDYRGQYPLAGNSKDIEGTFTDDVVSKTIKIMQNIF